VTPELLITSEGDNLEKRYGRKFRFFDAIWNFFSPNRVMFGPGAASQTGAIVRMLGGEKVLIITSPVISKIGLVKGVEESLRSERLRRKFMTGRTVNQPCG